MPYTWSTPSALPDGFDSADAYERWLNDSVPVLDDARDDTVLTEVDDYREVLS